MPSVYLRNSPSSGDLRNLPSRGELVHLRNSLSSGELSFLAFRVSLVLSKLTFVAELLVRFESKDEDLAFTLSRSATAAAPPFNCFNTHRLPSSTLVAFTNPCRFAQALSRRYSGAIKDVNRKVTETSLVRWWRSEMLNGSVVGWFWCRNGTVHSI